MKAPCGLRKNNSKTRKPHIATNPLAHPPTDRPNCQRSRTSLPTHDVLQQYSSVRTAGLASMLSLSHNGSRTGISIYPPSGGASDQSPGGPFHAPRSTRTSLAPFCSLVRHGEDVRDVHGATARPREAKWSLRLAAVLWLCYDLNIFKDTNEYCDVTSVSYSKDMCAVVINI